MKKLLCLFALLAANLHVVFAQQWVDSRDRELVITTVNIIPMDEERVQTNQNVIIKDGKIAAIGSKVKYSKNALAVDGKGKYLMPGLAEMHAHVPPIDDLEPMKEVLYPFAANGITTIRGMLGHPKHIELISLINRGEINGPTCYTTGQKLI